MRVGAWLGQGSPCALSLESKPRERRLKETEEEERREEKRRD